MLLTELLLILITVLVLVLYPATEAQRFSLRGVSYPNHGLVLRDDIGDTDNIDLDPNNGLHCVSFSGCCDSSSPRGEFVFPGRTLVPRLSSVGNTGYYRNRRSDRIFLNRQPTGTIQGIFECLIRTDSTQTIYNSFYIGVYDADTGSPSISDVTFGSVSKTLTCTSSGGPATTVTWRRNCLVLQNSSDFVHNQVVTSKTLATYKNTLMLNGADIDGVYTCSVKNSRGYSSSMTGIGTGYTPNLPVAVTITRSGTPVAAQSFTLTCQATTTLASPSYQWFDDGGNLVGNVSTLTLNPLLESNTGEYSCQVTAGDGVSQRFGCGVSRVVVQAPSLTVTVNNADSAVAGEGHTLSCTVMGADLRSATVMYTWKLNGMDIPGATANQYSITPVPVQVSNAGDVYTCQVTVTAASYWDVSGSFGGSGNATLNVTIRTPTVQFTRLILGSLYVGLNFTWRCEVHLLGRQLAGVSAAVDLRGPSGDVMTSDSRITIGDVVQAILGRTFQRSVMFSPLSAGDVGSYSCSATVMPTVMNSNVKNGVGTANESLNVATPTVTVTIDRSGVPSRVLDLPSYNGFSLTCTATSRVLTNKVPITKVITWTRSVGGGNVQVLDMFDVNTNDIIVISHMDLAMATTTSELIVNTTLPGSHNYTCSARLEVMPAPDDIRGQGSTIIMVQGEASPNLPTGLTAIDITHNSAIIQWTVTSLVYGPEMYVVVYGTDMSNLNQTSSMVTSGNDITRTNFNLNVRLSGLDMMTTYYYRVVAMNSESVMITSEDIGVFNTSGTAVPDPPTMLEGVASTNPDDPPSLSFTWLAPNVTNGDILDYQLTCAVPEGVPMPQDVTSLTTSAMISSLNNGVEYCCTVSARNAQGHSMSSLPCCVRTVEIAPNGTPQNFVVQVTGSRNLTFMWLPPIITERNGVITRYNLTCVNTTAGRQPFLTRVYPAADSNLYLLTGFKPFTYYSCRVFAINSAGRGPEATINQTTFQDEPDGPPRDITFEMVAGVPSQVMFNFNPPREDLRNGLIIQYRISCANRGGSREPISDNFPASQARPYSLMNLIPATLYDCSLSASTSVGFGVTATVEVLTMPDKPTVVSITPNRRSLLVTWENTNPPLSEGAVISGYHVYLDGQRNQTSSNSAMTTFNITSLSPFTNYSVEISAYNTRGDGMEQEGPRSEPVNVVTLGELPGQPVCSRRWLASSLTSLTINWEPPKHPNGIITGYFLQLVSFDNATVLQSGNVSNTLSYSFAGYTIVAGVPYHVRVYAENTNGRGSYCITTDFGDQLSPPSNILNDLAASSFDASDPSAIILTWTVLPLDQTKGFVTLSITFGPLVSNGRQKRQTSTECDQSPCRVPYEQRSVRITGLDSQQDHFIVVIPENGEGEMGTPTVLGIATMLQPSIKSSVSDSAAAVSGMAAVIVVLTLFLLLAVFVIVLLFVRLQQHKHIKHLAEGSQLDNAEILTTQCEAYEVMKRHDKPTGADLEQTYEELELITTERGAQARATPTQERANQHNEYEELAGGAT